MIKANKNKLPCVHFWGAFLMRENCVTFVMLQTSLGASHFCFGKNYYDKIIMVKWGVPLNPPLSVKNSTFIINFLTLPFAYKKYTRSFTLLFSFMILSSYPEQDYEQSMSTSLKINNHFLVLKPFTIFGFLSR